MYTHIEKILLPQTTSCDIILIITQHIHITSYDITYTPQSHHIVSYHITSHHIIPVMSCHSTWFHIISYHVISCHDVSIMHHRFPESPSRPSFFLLTVPQDDDSHHFPRCVFLVFVSVVHLRFMLPFFFHIRFAHTRLGFFPTRPDIKLCYAGCFAQRAQSAGSHRKSRAC